MMQLKASKSIQVPIFHKQPIASPAISFRLKLLDSSHELMKGKAGNSKIAQEKLLPKISYNLYIRRRRRVGKRLNNRRLWRYYLKLVKERLLYRHLSVISKRSIK